MTTSPTHQQHLPAQAPLLNLPTALSPDSIDTIPVLATILSRLQSIENPNSQSGSPPAASPSQIASGTGPLTIKDIPTATDDLKHKLQRARASMRELPDVERTVEEQEVEIRELEMRIAEQRVVLEGLRGVGKGGKRDEGSMES